MKEKEIFSELYDGEKTQSELAQLSFDKWSREQAEEFVTVPGKRVVDIYTVVRSVIENDLTPAEQTAVIRCVIEGESAAAVAEETGVSRASVYKALARGKEKIKLVLKHLIDCEEYKVEI